MSKYSICSCLVYSTKFRFYETQHPVLLLFVFLPLPISIREYHTRCRSYGGFDSTKVVDLRRTVWVSLQTMDVMSKHASSRNSATAEVVFGLLLELVDISGILKIFPKPLHAIAANSVTRTTLTRNLQMEVERRASSLYLLLGVPIRNTDHALVDVGA